MKEEKSDFFRWYENGYNDGEIGNLNGSKPMYQKLVSVFTRSGMFDIERLTDKNHKDNFINGMKLLFLKDVAEMEKKYPQIEECRKSKKKFEEEYPDLYKQFNDDLYVAFEKKYKDLFYNKDENGNLTLKSEDEILKVLETICKENDDRRSVGKNIKEWTIGLAPVLTMLGMREKEDEKETGVDKCINKVTEMTNEQQGKYTPEDVSVLFFLTQMKVQEYDPRTTMFTASYLMSQGALMNIGCSQGKTSIVTQTALMKSFLGEKIFATASAPGLVFENLDGTEKSFRSLGRKDEVVVITKDEDSGNDQVVLLGDKGRRIHIDEKGNITVAEKKGKEVTKTEVDFLNLSVKEQEQLKNLGIDFTKGFDFGDLVQNAMKKSVVMIDNITIAKYNDKLPLKNGKVEGLLLDDEADVTLYDANPVEVLGESFEEGEAKKRWENRKEAYNFINERQEKTKQEILKEAIKQGIPEEFIIDALTAEEKIEENYIFDDKTNSVLVMNPHTSTWEPAPQGISEAILAKNAIINNEPERPTIINPERKVERIVYPQEKYSWFSNISLMSGTINGMEVKDKYTTSQAYTNMQYEFFSKCGPGLVKSLINVGGVPYDFKLVTPKTREEKGNVVVTPEGIQIDKDNNIKTIEKDDDIEVSDWRAYLAGKGGEELDKQWSKAIKEQAEAIAKEGQPVMLSTYGDKRPQLEGREDIQVYTGTERPDSKKNRVRYIGDDIVMTSKPGKTGKQVGTIAMFDDYFGRGYTIKFYEQDAKGRIKTKIDNGKEKPLEIDKGGHVLITSLPENGRNLEQFLFRVARGGKNGSSSMIINPNDPQIFKLLEKIEEQSKDLKPEDLEKIYGGEDGPIPKEFWDKVKENPEEIKNLSNVYFSQILKGKVPVERIVFDIYPEETMKIFQDKIDSAKSRDVIFEIMKDIKDPKYLKIANQEAVKVLNKRDLLGGVISSEEYSIGVAAECLSNGFKDVGRILPNGYKVTDEGIVDKEGKLVRKVEIKEQVQDKEENIEIEDKQEDIKNIEIEDKYDNKEEVELPMAKYSFNEIPEIAKNDKWFNLETIKQSAIYIRDKIKEKLFKKSDKQQEDVRE